MNKDLIIRDLELLINDIKLHGKKGKEYYMNEYKNLYDFNKVIFNKVCESGEETPFELVKTMIEYKFKLDEGSIQQYDANVIIGQQCFDHYVAPKLQNI